MLWLFQCSCGHQQIILSQHQPLPYNFSTLAYARKHPFSVLLPYRKRKTETWSIFSHDTAGNAELDKDIQQGLE